MEIVVLVKQVPDTATKLKLNGNQIDPAGIKWVMNPYDEFAVEEALLLKTKEAGSKVTVLSLGPARAVETIRVALAMGADEAIHIKTDNEQTEPQTTAQALAKVIQTELPGTNIIFSGWKAVDDDAAQVSQATAERLDFSHAFQAVKFEHQGDKVTVNRELEGGTVEVVELPLPAVIACQKGLNTPRYASLPGIMQAKKKPVKEIPMSEVGLEGGEKIEVTTMELPQEKGAGKIIKPEGDDLTPAVKELIGYLRDEAKVL